MFGDNLSMAFLTSVVMVTAEAAAAAVADTTAISSACGIGASVTGMAADILGWKC